MYERYIHKENFKTNKFLIIKLIGKVLKGALVREETFFTIFNGNLKLSERDTNPYIFIKHIFSVGGII